MPAFGIPVSSPPRSSAEFGHEWKEWLTTLWRYVVRRRVLSQQLTPSSVLANSTAEQTFTVNGLTTNDIVIVNKPSHDNGIVVGNARVSSADTLAITFANISGGNVTPAQETYEIIAISKVGP